MVPACGCTCHHVLIHPLELSACVHTKCCAQPPLMAQTYYRFWRQDMQKYPRRENVKLAEQQICQHWRSETTRERHWAVYKTGQRLSWVLFFCLFNCLFPVTIIDILCSIAAIFCFIPAWFHKFSLQLMKSVHGPLNQLVVRHFFFYCSLQPTALLRWLLCHHTIKCFNFLFFF